MNLNKLDTKVISGCSPRHIQIVIEDLLQVLSTYDNLAQEVLTLNLQCCEIGQGKMLRLQELARCTQKGF
jgi:hypothetical protein